MKQGHYFLACAAVLALILVLPMQETHAQTKIELGPSVGYEINAWEAVSAGADARIHLASLPVSINPTFEYYFVGDQGLGDDVSYTVFQLSANAIYEFDIENDALTPYAGAGLGYTRASVSADSEYGSFSLGGSDVGLNLLGGATFQTGNLKPFVQGKFTLSDGNLFGISGGLLFSLQ